MTAEKYIVNHKLTVSKLDWDSAHFGLNVGKISSNISDIVANRGLLKKVHEDFDLVVLSLMNPSENETQLVTECGFELVDQKVDLCRIQKLIPKPWVQLATAFGCRLANKNDIYELKQLPVEFKTRYFSDTHFPRDRVQLIYKIWVEKAVRSTFDDECWVLETENKIIGFCTLKYSEVNKVKQARIGLIGISPQWSGKGLASGFLSEIISGCEKRGISRLFVATQKGNFKALRMYEGFGFETLSTTMIFHAWAPRFQLPQVA